MFERTEYEAVVGESRFLQGRQASIIRNRESSKEHGEELRKKLLETIDELRRGHQVASRKEIAARSQTDLDVVRVHVRTLLDDQMIIRLPGYFTSYDITERGKRFLQPTRMPERRPLEIVA